MAKVVIMYEKPKDVEGFEKHYFKVHVPLGKKIPNLKKDSIHRVIQNENTDLSLYLITILEFENMSTLIDSLASKEAKAAEEDGKELFQYLHKPPIITIIE